MSALPSSSLDVDPRPAPGGAKRFVIALLVTMAILVGVVLGIGYWMSATSHSTYTGPQKLTYPEKRPFR